MKICRIIRVTEKFTDTPIKVAEITVILRSAKEA